MIQIRAPTGAEKEMQKHNKQEHGRQSNYSKWTQQSVNFGREEREIEEMPEKECEEWLQGYSELQRNNSIKLRK